MSEDEDLVCRFDRLYPEFAGKSSALPNERYLLVCVLRAEGRTFEEINAEIGNVKTAWSIYKTSMSKLKNADKPKVKNSKFDRPVVVKYLTPEGNLESSSIKR